MNRNIDLQLHRTRRGVAPVIATLLLVAIAVVGGGIVFAYSQSFFSSSQISGKPTIEALKIIGYDARAVAIIQNQNGGNFEADATDNNDSAKNVGENVAAYIKNDSVQSITLSELRFGGSTYAFANPAPATVGALASGTYTIAGANGGTAPDLVTTSSVAVVQPGQTVSVVLSLAEDMKSGRDTQFKLTTTNGAVFVGTVVIGQQSG